MSKFLLWLSIWPILIYSFNTSNSQVSLKKEMASFESKFQAKIGLYAFDTNSHKQISYNENIQFPFQSTFKLIAVGALLYQDQQTPLLNETVKIKAKDIVPWVPLSQHYLNKPISYLKLAEAAIRYSDNTAVNLIIKRVGGLEKMNVFADKIGNKSFRLNHYEANLNSNPELLYDTSTPRDMADSYWQLLYGHWLDDHHRTMLKHWLTNNTTGYDRIRAGVPLGWSVADKTGSGGYGIANDIGEIWSSNCKPVIFSIYTLSNNKGQKPSGQLVAEITRKTITAFSKFHSCYYFTEKNVVFNTMKGDINVN